MIHIHNQTIFVHLAAPLIITGICHENYLSQQHLRLTNKIQSAGDLTGAIDDNGPFIIIAGTRHYIGYPREFHYNLWNLAEKTRREFALPRDYEIIEISPDSAPRRHQLKAAKSARIYYKTPEIPDSTKFTNLPAILIDRNEYCRDRRPPQYTLLNLSWENLFCYENLCHIDFEKDPICLISSKIGGKTAIADILNYIFTGKIRGKIKKAANGDNFRIFCEIKIAENIYRIERICRKLPKTELHYYRVKGSQVLEDLTMPDEKLTLENFANFMPPIGSPADAFDRLFSSERIAAERQLAALEMQYKSAKSDIDLKKLLTEQREELNALYSNLRDDLNLGELKQKLKKCNDPAAKSAIEEDIRRAEENDQIFDQIQKLAAEIKELETKHEECLKHGANAAQIEIKHKINQIKKESATTIAAKFKESGIAAELTARANEYLAEIPNLFVTITPTSPPSMLICGRPYELASTAEKSAADLAIRAAILPFTGHNLLISDCEIDKIPIAADKFLQKILAGQTYAIILSRNEVFANIKFGGKSLTNVADPSAAIARMLIGPTFLTKGHFLAGGDCFIGDKCKYCDEPVLQSRRNRHVTTVKHLKNVKIYGAAQRINKETVQQ